MTSENICSAQKKVKIEEYQVDYWDDYGWHESRSFVNKDDAEKEINELLNFHDPRDIRLIAYFTQNCKEEE